LGFVDRETRKPVYNEKYLPFVASHNLDPDTVLQDYINRRKMNVDIDFTDHLKIIMGEESLKEQETPDADSQRTNEKDLKIIIPSEPSIVAPKSMSADWSRS
jgi:hypothetical protein